MDRKVCFVHVPKCGGTSVTTALRNAMRGSESRSSEREFVLNSNASAATATQVGLDIMQFRHALASYHLRQDHIRFVGGHFPCPPDLLDAFAATTDFLTVLRDPVERWISHYLYARHKTGGHYTTKASVEEYLASDLGQSNGHIYLTYFAPRGMMPGGAAVEQAKATLDRFAIVATVENLETLAESFRHRYRRQLSIGQERRTPAPEAERRALKSPAIRADIEHVCRWDRLVYEHAADSGNVRQGMSER